MSLVLERTLLADAACDRLASDNEPLSERLSDEFHEVPVIAAEVVVRCVLRVMLVAAVLVSRLCNSESLDLPDGRRNSAGGGTVGSSEGDIGVGA
jgi:hypothetical protein